MTIAGTDSSGGAGIQADIKTFTAFGCYGTSVITAMTAQNTTGVQGVHPSPPEFVRQQLHSVLSDVKIEAIKTGMLFDADNTVAVAASLKAHFGGPGSAMPPLVCDPVCVSTSGHTLLQPDAVKVMISDLFPITALVTPNRQEAELLLSQQDKELKISSLEDMVSAAKKLRELGPKAVLLKGGHIVITMQDIERVCSSNPDIEVVKDALLGDNMEILQASEADAATRELVVDVLHQSNGSTSIFVRPRINSTSTHGTGCTLSAAITSALARGLSIRDATSLATSYTHAGIETAFPIGSGYGPLNHMHSITLRNIPKPTLSNPHPFTRLLIKSTSKIWKEYVEHDFVKQLGQGTLRRECFIHFIKQDYHYLKYYGRAYALLGAKSPSYPAIQAAAQTMFNVVNEVKTHVSFCEQWGITEEELKSTPESSATTAYGAFIIDTGLQGDRSKLIMALAACLLGYGEVGLWLRKQASLPNSWVKWEGNPYLKWMEDYSGEHYQNAVKAGLDTIEAEAAADPPSIVRFQEWVATWERCTRLEKGFWDMALGLL
ncbi:hypothetical protein GLOTRDRAFT_82113 [Gloeophyllum trabeum ATCC 11539]|uniref:Phosphomethylpyrimidine kinase n=1 Tax=Gloeophyllum trabeum (strain ATCC 11539 / FP-39264 / Madison 617) TaxID=670483 RepID=S7PT65_GLOTA|nr:uncharacterized protein GLOTRDRAFT_82113 [Gloeophyllum trabeum ATCC 11539]EPQ50588.1 hypothetical protein GLOTRDRAFT_82113 [Gloeophyllum trabeum ATCC 11539]